MDPKPAPGRVSKQALVSAGSCTKGKFPDFLWGRDDRALVGPPGAPGLKYKSTQTHAYSTPAQGVCQHFKRLCGGRRPPYHLPPPWLAGPAGGVLGGARPLATIQTLPKWPKNRAPSRNSRGERGRVREGGGGWGDGFTLCVSAAVETTGWHHAQQRRRYGELVDLQLLYSAKLGAAQAHPGAGEAWRRRKMVARPRRGKIYTLQRQSGGIWACTSPGWGSPASDIQGVARCPTSGGGGTAPPPTSPHREKEPGAYCWPTVMAVVPPTTAGAEGLPHALPTTSMSASININIHVDVHVQIQMWQRVPGG